MCYMYLSPPYKNTKLFGWIKSKAYTTETEKPKSKEEKNNIIQNTKSQATEYINVVLHSSSISETISIEDQVYGRLFGWIVGPRYTHVCTLWIGDKTAYDTGTQNYLDISVPHVKFDLSSYLLLLMLLENELYQIQ